MFGVACLGVKCICRPYLQYLSYSTGLQTRVHNHNHIACDGDHSQALYVGILYFSDTVYSRFQRCRIHHPFLLSDNRHYTFYLWRRIYMLHPTVPYILIPVYVACAWAWFLRVGMWGCSLPKFRSVERTSPGREQTLLQTLILPVFILPTLLPTPLLEPRYFLIPYILLRCQVVDVPKWGLALEGVWYAGINAGTMYVFLYMPREGVGRFMW